MTRRRRRSRGSPRCRDCGAPVVFFRTAMGGGWRPFEPKPVHPGHQMPELPYSIENGVLAWPYAYLVEDLMVRLECGHTEAEEHALAMPRHLPHRCKNRPETQKEEQDQ